MGIGLSEAFGAAWGASWPYGRRHRLSQGVTPSRLRARGSVDMGTWSVSWVDPVLSRPAAPMVSASRAGTTAPGAYRTDPPPMAKEPAGGLSRGCGRR